MPSKSSQRDSDDNDRADSRSRADEASKRKRAERSDSEEDGDKHRPAADGLAAEPEGKRPRADVEDGPMPARQPDDANGAAGTAAQPSLDLPRKPVAPSKTGGVYIPPFKLARMMQEVKEKSSPEYQKLTWEALKKSINGIINKVNVTNIKNMLAEVFRENLIRGRGLFCRSLMKSQLASPTFSAVYAALVAVVNTKFPELGELLLHRLVLQFMRSYKRNDKPVCTAAARFLGHLINQGVAHEVLALEMLILMLEKPSADSVEMACEFIKEVGAYLQEVAPSGLHSVFERFRAVLHEGDIDKRVQFVIEGLFAVRKAGFEKSGHVAVPKELDLVEAEDQITHEVGLDDPHDPQVALDLFKVDPDFEQHENEFKAISREILGLDEDASEDESQGDKSPGEDDEEEQEEDEEEQAAKAQEAAKQQAIEDATQTNLVNLRRTIYLTIMSSMDFEEAGHKLLKIGIQPGQEIELVTMIIECCSQERTYKRFYGLLAQRFCYLNRAYMDRFDECFQNQYAVIHRLETNKLRNVASLFAHLLVTDAIPWSTLGCIRLTEEDTTSSSRIFIKYLFQEISSSMGVLKLAERLDDPTTQQWYDGIFPKDTQANLRFSINFFTSIGLGGLTDKMRKLYAEMPRLAAERAQREAEQVAKEAAKQRALMGGDTTDEGSSSGSDDSSDSDSSGSSSSSSSSDSSSSVSSSSDDSSSSSSSSSDSEDEGSRRKRGRGGAQRDREEGAKKGQQTVGNGKAAVLPPPPPAPPRGRDGGREERWSRKGPDDGRQGEVEKSRQRREPACGGKGGGDGRREAPSPPRRWHDVRPKSPLPTVRERAGRDEDLDQQRNGSGGGHEQRGGDDRRWEERPTQRTAAGENGGGRHSRGRVGHDGRDREDHGAGRRERSRS